MLFDRLLCSSFVSMYNRRFNDLKNQGNILFMILIAIVLFAVLTQAVIKDMSGNGKNASTEIATLDAAKMADYITLVQNTSLRLKLIEGCSSVDYTTPENQPGSGDFSCYMFHPDGGAVPYIDYGAGCDLQGIDPADLEIGESCGNVIYFGSLSGTRLYTYIASVGNFAWSLSSGGISTSDTDGLGNTDTMIDDDTNTYPAAEACRALGEEWYLPALDELSLLLSNNDQGQLTSLVETGNYYWSSTEKDSSRGKCVRQYSLGGATTECDRAKSSTYKTQCVKQ